MCQVLFTSLSQIRVFRAFSLPSFVALRTNERTQVFSGGRRIICPNLYFSRNMRPIFCGNFEYDARQSDLERLFSKYGKVERVDMKSGFAFVYMDDERDAEDAIRGLDRAEFGRQGRRLRVEWTKQERGIRRPVGSRKSSGSSRPTKTLFVINFDPIHTRTRDLERHFDPYGKILNIRIRRNFAFIQFELQEDATKALDATNMSKLMDRVISVEYAVRDDDERKNGYSPDRRGRGRSSERSRDRGRSSSPYRRERASPDYGHGPVSNKRHDTRESPYGRERASPDYGRGPSPIKRRETRESPYEREKASPDNGRAPSPVKRRERRDSSYERERASPRDASPIKRREPRESSYERERASPRGASPVKRREPRESSYERERASPRGPSPIKRRESRESPYERERGSPDFGPGSSPPVKRHASRESPEFDRPKSPEYERYRSRSPSVHE